MSLRALDTMCGNGPLGHLHEPLSETGCDGLESSSVRVFLRCTVQKERDLQGRSTQANGLRTGDGTKPPQEAVLGFSIGDEVTVLCMVAL